MKDAAYWGEELNHCDICGKQKDMLIVTTYGKLVCDSCMLTYDPPKMTLMTYTLNDRVWNLEVGKHEEVDSIIVFELCHWFVRSKQETMYKICPRTKVTVHNMEYYGDIRCCRCLDYPYWPKGWSLCSPEICSPYMIKRDPEDIIWPREGRSKYYELRQRF